MFCCAQLNKSKTAFGAKDTEPKHVRIQQHNDTYSWFLNLSPPLLNLRPSCLCQAYAWLDAFGLAWMHSADECIRQPMLSDLLDDTGVASSVGTNRGINGINMPHGLALIPT